VREVEVDLGEVVQTAGTVAVVVLEAVLGELETFPRDTPEQVHTEGAVPHGDGAVDPPAVAVRSRLVVPQP
jgi:hypothetical protein